MSELKMKACKECGKMFMPTSNKQRYCSEKHYRPCPVCGKPVFAKYLSDPARCCSGVCKSKLGKQNKSSDDTAVSADLETKTGPTSNLVPMPGIEKIADLKAEYTHEVNESKVKVFCGEEKFGFVYGHRYEVEYVSEGKGQHMIEAKYDVTEDEPVAIRYIFTNKKHISKAFK